MPVVTRAEAVSGLVGLAVVFARLNLVMAPMPKTLAATRKTMAAPMRTAVGMAKGATRARVPSIRSAAIETTMAGGILSSRPVGCGAFSGMGFLEEVVEIILA